MTLEQKLAFDMLNDYIRDIMFEVKNDNFDVEFDEKTQSYFITYDKNTYFKVEITSLN